MPDRPHGAGSTTVKAARRLFWLALFVAYAIVGLGGFQRAYLSQKTDDSGAFSGSDSILSVALRAPHASQALLDIFDQLPSGKPMVIFWPQAAGNAVIVPQLTGYLAWPRKVLSAPTDGAHLARLSDFMDRPVLSARIYYLFKPPQALPGAQSVGAMTIVPGGQSSR